jgi:hypothetical protein
MKIKVQKTVSETGVWSITLEKEISSPSSEYTTVVIAELMEDINRGIEKKKGKSYGQ